MDVLTAALFLITGALLCKAWMDEFRAKRQRASFWRR